MASRIRRLGVLAALTAVSLFGVVLMALSYSEVGISCEIGTGGIPLSVYEVTPLPQSVVDDATRLATELYGDSQEKCTDFTRQLLTMYREAQDKDFIVIFNSGGWGSNLVETSQGWWSIFGGIQSELSDSGYKLLMLNYQRTVEDLRGCLNEVVEMFTDYPSKAKDLACRVDFLTGHIPDLKVILAGESNGTVICDSVMDVLEDNPQVYYIQTGPPFWHRSTMQGNKLLLLSNGIVPDSFSDGDVPAMVRANLKVLLRISQRGDEPGTILRLVVAPGHDYGWHYQSIYTEITNFLDEKFGLKWQ